MTARTKQTRLDRSRAVLEGEPGVGRQRAEERFRLILTRMLWVAFPAQVALLAAFLAVGLTLHAWVGAVGLAAFIALYLLARAGKLHLAFALGVGEVVTHAAAATYTLGWTSGFHSYLLLLPILFVLHPRWSTTGKAVACLALCLAYGGLALYDLLSGVPTGITHDTANTLAIINAVTFAAALSILAFIAAKVTADAESGLLRVTAKLRDLSHRDPLTGLLNRRAMTALLRTVDERARIVEEGYAIVLVDIDRFKRVNDEHGHAAGDTVIEAVAAALRTSLRSSDQVARWGGEEFLVLLPNTSHAGAAEVAGKMARAVRNRAVVAEDGREIRITATFGVAVGGSNDGSAATIRTADDAMYRGKKAGRNRVVAAWSSAEDELVGA